MEFDRITERGGVLGAMETMYQRGKNTGREHLLRDPQNIPESLPIIGVNTFLNKEAPHYPTQRGDPRHRGGKSQIRTARNLQKSSGEK